MCGEESANEWAISRTPRVLANEIKQARQKALEEQLHLDSPSTSDTEYEPAWRRSIRELRDEKRQAKAQAKIRGQTKAQAKSDAQARAQIQSQAQDPVQLQLQLQFRMEPQAQAPLFSESYAESKAEQPITKANKQQSLKKRGALPTPITPSLKKARVV